MDQEKIAQVILLVFFLYVGYWCLVTIPKKEWPFGKGTKLDWFTFGVDVVILAGWYWGFWSGWTVISYYLCKATFLIFEKGLRWRWWFVFALLAYMACI